MRFIVVLSVVLGVRDPDRVAHVRLMNRKLSYSNATYCRRFVASIATTVKKSKQFRAFRQIAIRPWRPGAARVSPPGTDRAKDAEILILVHPRATGLVVTARSGSQPVREVHYLGREV
jgi:hypothetical protein